jgi:hypothetical protein
VSPKHRQGGRGFSYVRALFGVRITSVSQLARQRVPKGRTPCRRPSHGLYFLRPIEHRIQSLDDQQTHVLPSDYLDLAWIANTLVYDNLQPFLERLDAHKEVVAQEFDKPLGGGASKPCNGDKPASADSA